MTPIFVALAAVVFPAVTAAGDVPCRYAPPPKPRPTPSAPARLLVEVRLSEDTPTRDITATLAPLSASGLPVVVLVPPAWSSDDPQFRFPSRGVDIAIYGSVSDLMGSTVADPTALFMSDWRSALKRSRRSVSQATGIRPKVIAMPTPPQSGEAAIDEAGFQALFVMDPGADAPPRRARAHGGRTGRTRVVTEGVPADSCGALLGTPTAAALDRVTLTGPGQVVSRVALPPDEAVARELALWWKQTAAPADWKAWSLAMLYVRAGAPPLATPTTQAPSDPRSTLETSQLAEAAAAIEHARRLPRAPSGNLNLTEAFVGLAAWAVEPGHERYSVPFVGPPPEEARSTLKPATTLDAASVRQVATTLLPTLQGRLPALITVGDQTLTAGEFLLALALLHQNQPIRLRTIGSPDPYAPGGGWGTVRGPQR